MPRRDGQEFDDDEEEDAFDGVDEDEPADDTMPCPHCGATIYDDAARCPKCGEYLSDEPRRTTSQPRWVIITAVIVLAALTLAFLR